MYDNYCNQLSATGNLYDIELEGHKRIITKTTEGSPEYTDQYKIDYNSDIFSDVSKAQTSNINNLNNAKVLKNNVYLLNENDQFYVKLKNSSTTMAGAIFNTIVPTSKKDRIKVNYGGIIKNNAWKEVKSEYYTQESNMYYYDKYNLVKGYYYGSTIIDEVGDSSCLGGDIVVNTLDKVKFSKEKGYYIEDKDKDYLSNYTIGQTVYAITNTRVYSRTIKGKEDRMGIYYYSYNQVKICSIMNGYYYGDSNIEVGDRQGLSSDIVVDSPYKVQFSRDKGYYIEDKDNLGNYDIGDTIYTITDTGVYKCTIKGKEDRMGIYYYSYNQIKKCFHFDDAAGDTIIETITSEDGIYPENGPLGGYWYKKGSLVQ